MNEQPDDVERLLSRMAPVEPPADFLANVLRQTQGAAVEHARQAAWMRWLSAAVYLAAMLVLLLLAYGLGLAIGHNGTSTLLSELAADTALFTDAPVSYIAAIATSLPWLQVAAVVCDLALVWIVTQLIVNGPKRDSTPNAPA
jgi:hypothetical protein